MKELEKNELMEVDGGNVPTAFYMDSDVINANAEVAGAVAPVYGKLLEFFWTDLVRYFCL